MNCNVCKKLINTYLDGYLPSGREEEIFHHISDCPKCERYYEDLIEVYDQLHEADREVPYGFSYAWREAVEQVARKKRKVNYKVLIPALAACVCGVFVMSMLVFGTGGYKPMPNMGESALSLEYKMQNGQQNGQQPQSDAQSEADEAQTVQSGGAGQTGGNVAGQEANNLVEQNEPVQNTSTAQDAAIYDEFNEPANSENNSGVNDAPSVAGMQSAPDATMPQIVSEQVNGETVYTLNARDMDISKDLLLEYAAKYNIDVTETTNGVKVQASPFLMELLLKFYGIEPVEGMDNLEIILY